jgi:hypothetical protein
MAANVEIILKMIDQTKGVLGKITDDAGKLGKTATQTGGGLSGLSGKIASMINPATLAVGAFTALGTFMIKAANAAAESAQVDAKLEAVLKATGNAAGMTAAEIDGMSTSLSNMTGVDDEVIKSSAAVLATFREVGEDVFPDATRAALDMSAVMGQDLQSSIVQIGKALNDPIAGVSALRRVGVQLTDQQKDQIATFMESGDVLSAQKVILSELSMEFGGAAESIHNAGTKADSLRVAFGNWTEAIGSGTLPALAKLNQTLADFLNHQAEVINMNNDQRTSSEESMRAGQELIGTYEEWSKAITGTTENYGNAEVSLVKYRAALLNAGDMARKLAADDMYVAESLDAVTASAVLSEEELQEMSKENEKYLSVLGNVSGALEAFNAGQAEINKKFEDGNYVASLYYERQQELWQSYADGEIKTNQYNEASKNLYMSYKDGTFAANESKAAIAELAGEYESATNKIVLSIVSMKFATEGWTNAELAAYLQIGKGLGEFTDAQINATTEAITQAEALVSSYDELDDPMLHVAERAKDADEAFGGMARATAELGESLRKEGASGAAALTAALNGIPTEINVDVNIRVHGSLPKGIMGGTAGTVLTQCFVAGTLVTLSDGTRKPIEQLQVGDEVRSYNIERREFVAGKVSKVMSRDVTEYLNIDGILVTEEHPFWHVGRGEWVKAKDIRRNDFLLRDYGGTKVVNFVFKVSEPATVYNLTVDGEHNYFAGGVLVHNKSVDDFDSGTTPHASGGMFTIPHAYGNEGFMLGNGDTASGGEKLAISPKGQDFVDYDRLAAAMPRIDYRAMARAMDQVLQQRGY